MSWNAAALQVIPLVMLALAGCGRTGTHPVDDEVTGPRLSAEPIVRLGSIDDPAQSFTHIEGAVIGPGGEIIVSDAAANVIRIFDEGGEPLGTVGAPGEGPGHFSSLWRVSIDGDTLLAYDNRVVVSAFTLDGVFRRTVFGPGEQWMFARESPAGIRFSYLPMAPVTLTADGGAIIRANYIWDPGPMECTVGMSELATPIPILRVDVAGSIADTLLWAEDVRSSLLFRDGAAMHRWNTPFGRGAHVGALPAGRGLVIAEEGGRSEGRGQAIRLLALGFRGDTLWQRELPISPISITTGHLVDAAGRSPIIALPDCSPDGAASQPLPAPEQVAGAYARASGALTHLPALTGFSVGQDGSIWLRREESAPDSTIWQRLDPDGEPAGFLRLPIGEEVIAARENILLTREMDALDVPYLTRYQLTDR